MTDGRDFFDVVQGRRSIRKFLSDPVPLEDIRDIISTATKAPSASNRQMWRFVAVANLEMRERMRQAVIDALERIAEWPAAAEHKARILAAKSYGAFFAAAPVVIAVFSEGYASPTDDVLAAAGLTESQRESLRGRPDLQSVGAGIQTLLLAAHAKGYGTCWMCAPLVAAPEIQGMLDAPEGFSLRAIIPLGRPAEDPSPRPRKPLDDVMVYLP